ncbi:hypothetical protein HK100_001852 [Physocladia obscura]|uniref:Uncharacterized protein n=1 Tax=Physocladia obscura TaxID=109957 RepID=A0AAD5T922_9FUNG|nr:hypothetical protein HK100_001852 [Physocladia obscura]
MEVLNIRQQFEQMRERACASAAEHATVCDKITQLLLRRATYCRAFETEVPDNQAVCFNRGDFTTRNTRRLFRMLEISARHLPHMSSYGRNKFVLCLNSANKCITEKAINPYSSRNPKWLHWRINLRAIDFAKLAQEKTITISHKEQIPRPIKYPFDTELLPRFVADLFPPTQLEPNTVIQDIAFVVSAEYVKLLTASRKTNLALVDSFDLDYRARLLCYRAGDLSRHAVWPAEIIDILYVTEAESTTLDALRKPIPDVIIPRKLKVKIVLEGQNPDTVACQFVGSDSFADLTKHIHEGLNVVSVITSGTANINQYVLALEFVAFISADRGEYDARESALPVADCISKCNKRISESE